LTEQHAFAYVTWGNLFDGFRYPGALAGLLVTLPVLRRWLLSTISLGAVGDWLAPAMGFAEGVGRIGCFVAGCCFGVVSDLPWAVRFPPGSPAALFHVAQGWSTSETAPSLPVHPLQLYFAILALGLGGFCLWFRSHKRRDGDVLVAFIAIHEVGKFLLEFLRAPVAPEAGFYLRAASLAFALPALSIVSARAMRRGRMEAAA
jgi:phosphatidylglycerol:prolipoprotein diacylglycerol transferase